MTRLDVQIVVGEWILAVIYGLAFLVMFGRPWKAADRGMAWHIASFTAVSIIEALGLLAIALHYHVPLTSYAVIYGAGVAVILWRVALLVGAGRGVAMNKYAKAVIAAATAASTALVVALADGHITATEYVVAVTGTLIATAAVWATPNAPAEPEAVKE